MDRWQIIKNGMSIMICNDIEEAERMYLEFDADEIRRIDDENLEIEL